MTRCSLSACGCWKGCIAGTRRGGCWMRGCRRWCAKAPVRMRTRCWDSAWRWRGVSMSLWSTRRGWGWPAQRAKASEPCAADAPWMKTLGHCPTGQRPAQFDEDAVTVMNRDVPLRLWVEAAQSERLPPNLRQDVALAGWTRAAVLEDADDAAKLAPLLPSGLRGVAGVGFAADVAILRNPGLRPYLESGSTRLEQFGALDDFRDNWWDGQWKGRFASESPQLDQPDAKAILSAADMAAGQAEARRAAETKDGVTLIGQRVIAYAKAHPEDAGV